MALVVLGLLLLGAVLVVLALPLLDVRSGGNSAKANLTAALDELRDGDLPAATSRVRAARADVSAAQAAADGFRVDVLGFVPIAGGAVDDVRHLVAALDQAVAVAETGVELYPAVLGEDAALIRDGTVDLTTIASLSGVADEVSGYLTSARASLDQIGGSTPVVGETIRAARDEAFDQVVSLQSTLDSYRPLLDLMPSLLGADTTRTYLVAMMNPAELRASGGATLSLGEMTIDQGVISFGDAGNTTDFTDENSVISWPPVEGNPWHPVPDQKLVNATFSPNWTTSGEELLRAWEVTRGTRADGLIAMDVPALAELFRITGPIQAEGYGTLNAGNVVEKLVGSYDEFRNAEQRKRLNEAIIPLLRVKLLEGGKFVQKALAMVEQAQGRHFVTYFRDPAVQDMIIDLGLDGDLSTTTQDYLGVFTQNTNASKVDIWQRTSVASDVTLHPDGSADVVATITINNDGPPYEGRGQDPQRGYFTRWSIPQVIQSLPVGAELGEVTVDGAPVEVNPFAERDRTVLTHTLTLEPNTSAVLVVRYRVPQAAVMDADGTMTYALDIDPQGTVIPATYSVLLHLPDGFHEVSSSELWALNPDLTLQLDAIDGVRLRAEVTVAPD